MSQNTLKFGSRTVEISHPEKEFFPDAELAKADLVDYYRRIADVMVPLRGENWGVGWIGSRNRVSVRISNSHPSY